MCTLRERLEAGLDNSLFDRPGQKRRGWVRRNRAFFISLGIHAVLLWVAGLVVFNAIMRKEQQVLVCKRELKDDRFNDVPRNSFVRTPRMGEREILEKPVIYVEEEIEITQDIPDGLSFDHLSNKNLDSNSCIDAYGLGGGAAGVYGQRPANATLQTEACA
jgi:hypothetical protein